MIVIKEELIVRLQERLEKLWQVYGRCGSKLKDVDDLANLYIKNKLDKLDNIEKMPIVQNSGMKWLTFRRIHFQEIYERDTGRCQYCQKRLARKEATLDHVLAPIRGGKNIINNMKLSCGWCNVDKGVLTDEEYFYKQLVNKSKGIEPPK